MSSRPPRSPRRSRPTSPNPQTAQLQTGQQQQAAQSGRRPRSRRGSIEAQAQAQAQSSARTPAPSPVSTALDLLSGLDSIIVDAAMQHTPNTPATAASSPQAQAQSSPAAAAATATATSTSAAADAASPVAGASPAAGAADSASDPGTAGSTPVAPSSQASSPRPPRSPRRAHLKPLHTDSDGLSPPPIAAYPVQGGGASGPNSRQSTPGGAMRGLGAPASGVAPGDWASTPPRPPMAGTPAGATGAAGPAAGAGGFASTRSPLMLPSAAGVKLHNHMPPLSVPGHSLHATASSAGPGLYSTHATASNLAAPSSTLFPQASPGGGGGGGNESMPRGLPPTLPVPQSAPMHFRMLPNQRASSQPRLHLNAEEFYGSGYDSPNTNLHRHRDRPRPQRGGHRRAPTEDMRAGRARRQTSQAASEDLARTGPSLAYMSSGPGSSGGDRDSSGPNSGASSAQRKGSLASLSSLDVGDEDPEPFQPPPFMSQLSSSFLDRLPASMRGGGGGGGFHNSSFASLPGILTSPMISTTGIGTRHRRMRTGTGMGGAMSTPSHYSQHQAQQQAQQQAQLQAQLQADHYRASRSNVFAAAQTPQGTKLSLNEMANSARAVKNQLSRQGAGPAGTGAQRMLGPMTHTRAESILAAVAGAHANGDGPHPPSGGSNSLATRSLHTSAAASPAYGPADVEMSVSRRSDSYMAPLPIDTGAGANADGADGDEHVDGIKAAIESHSPRGGGGRYGTDALNPPLASIDDDMLQGLPSLPSILTSTGGDDDPYALDSSDPMQNQRAVAAEAARQRLAVASAAAAVSLALSPMPDDDEETVDVSAFARPRLPMVDDHYDMYDEHAGHELEAGLGADYVRTKDEERVIQIFLEEMGAALFSCGLPLHVVEFYLVLAAHRLHLDISIVAISTSFWITFAPSSTAHMVLAHKPGLSLSKMVDICSISEHILHGMCSPVEGLAQLQEVTRRPAQFNKYFVLPAMTLICFFYAPLFNSGWMECGVSAFVGFLIGLMELVSERHQSLARGHDLLAGLLAGGIAVLTHSYVRPINLLAAVFGGIVWCLPGLRITLSMLDLSTGNPVTGTAKFMSSLITAINLGIGVVAGMSVGQLTGLGDPSILASQSYGTVPPWFLPICIIGSTFPSIYMLDAHFKHFPQYIAGAAAAYYVSNYATIYIGQAFGSWLAAAGVGVMSNLYGRFTPFPSIELSLFSILMLVPGSIGVRSVLANDSLSTVSFLTQMITVAIAIVTGLFTANVVMPPVRVL